uniref:Uncharacterized protein n=1 Tax=Anguilla anguilla TaxID=7936 RepID=A0A0E9WME9_ANGAN
MGHQSQPRLQTSFSLQGRFQSITVLTEQQHPSLLTLSLQFKQSYLENIIVSPDYDNQLPYN